MAEFVIHGVPGSPYVRAALLALEEKALAWRLSPIGMGAHRSPEYRAIHPFNKVPTLDHGAFRLYETRAILGYVDRCAASPALTPTDSRDIARMDQMIGIVDSYVTPRVSAPVTFPRVIAPVFGMAADEAAIAAALGPAGRVIDEIARLLGDRKFMAGHSLSLADLMLIPHLSYLQACDEGRRLLEPHPALVSWISRMTDRQSMQATTWDRLRALAEAESLRSGAA